MVHYVGKCLPLTAMSTLVTTEYHKSRRGNQKCLLGWVGSLHGGCLVCVERVLASRQCPFAGLLPSLRVSGGLVMERRLEWVLRGYGILQITVTLTVFTIKHRSRDTE